MPFHKCTADDWSQFYPPEKSYVDTTDAAIARGNMFCLDESVDPLLFGNDYTDYSRLDIIYAPCGYNKSAVCPYN